MRETLHLKLVAADIEHFVTELEAVMITGLQNVQVKYCHEVAIHYYRPGLEKHAIQAKQAMY